MNLQAKTQSDLCLISREVAAEILKCNESDLNYWAWVERFPSTRGPFFGGIAGQAISDFTIEAWSFNSSAVLFCKGQIVKVTENFIPMKSFTK